MWMRGSVPAAPAHCDALDQSGKELRIFGRLNLRARSSCRAQIFEDKRERLAGFAREKRCPAFVIVGSRAERREMRIDEHS